MGKKSFSWTTCSQFDEQFFLSSLKTFRKLFIFTRYGKCADPKKYENFVSAQTSGWDPKNTKIRILYPKNTTSTPITLLSNASAPSPPPPQQKSRGPVRVQPTHFYLDFPVMVIILQILWGNFEQVTTINISINFWLSSLSLLLILDMLSGPCRWPNLKKMYEKAPETLLVPKAKGLDPHGKILLSDLAVKNLHAACWPVGHHSRGYFQ